MYGFRRCIEEHPKQQTLHGNTIFWRRCQNRVSLFYLVFAKSCSEVQCQTWWNEWHGVFGPGIDLVFDTGRCLHVL